MKTLIVLLAAAALIAQSPSLMAQTTPAAPAAEAGTTDAAKTGTTEGNETSDRTPEKKSLTPEGQVDTTKQGETSDRTPSMHKMGMMGCSDAEMMKMNGEIEAMSAGSGKTMAMDHMKMAKDSMAKSDMSGCSMHMNEAMGAMDKK
jgi:hypothetical protein